MAVRFVQRIAVRKTKVFDNEFGQPDRAKQNDIHVLTLPVSVFILMLSAFLCFFSIPTAALEAEVNELTENTLIFCADPDWMPFEGIVDGKHTGIASDYVKILTEQTPFTFEPYLSKSWVESTEHLASGNCDLTLMLNSSQAREKYLSFSIPFFFGPNVFVTKKDQEFLQDFSSLGDLKLGVVSGYRLLETISQYYPWINVVQVPSEEEGLKALNNEEVDVYVGSLFSINLRLEQLALEDLKINGWTSVPDQLRIGFTKENEHLVATFNHAIEKISTKQHNEILNRWSNVQIVTRTDHTFLFLGAFVFSILIAIFAWRNSVVRKTSAALTEKNAELEQARNELVTANKDLEYISFHDQLTKLYNRHYFLSSLGHHLSNVEREKSNSAILMLDIDHFKKINDNYGHLVGDEILKKFAKVVNHSIRSGDICARWGGEEFIVLLPSADKEQALNLADRIRGDVETASFAEDIRVTISVGVSQYANGDTIRAWIERADVAMYQAKGDGRNCIKLVNSL